MLDQGRSAAVRLAALYWRPNGGEQRRVATVVGRRVGNAVRRNRVRRRLREALRRNLHLVAPGFDLVVIARGAAARATFAEIEEAIRALLVKAGLVRQEGTGWGGPSGSPSN